jgi:thiamine-monophosphate kinase
MVSQRATVELARTMFATPDNTVSVGAGEDDCAIVLHEGSKLLISSDLRNHRRYIEVHSRTDFEEVGRFVVRQNVSDILGSGGYPRWFVLSVVLPGAIDLSDIELLFTGVKKESDKFSMSVIGGDTKQGDSLTICGTIIGEVGREPWVMSAAVPGQDIWVSGELGGVTAAVCLLEHSPNSAAGDRARRILTDADIPLEKLQRAIAEAEVRCGTDISDGLGMALHNVMRKSGVGANIECKSLPLHSLVYEVANVFGITPEQFAFGYGGDFQFLIFADVSQRRLLGELGFCRIGASRPASVNEMVGCPTGLQTIPDFGFSDFSDESPGQKFIRYCKEKMARCD